MIIVEDKTWTYAKRGEPIEPKNVFDLEAADDVWMNGNWNLVIDWAKITNDHKTEEYYFIVVAKDYMWMSIKDKSDYHTWYRLGYYPEENKEDEKDEAGDDEIQLLNTDTDEAGDFEFIPVEYADAFTDGNVDYELEQDEDIEIDSFEENVEENLELSE